MTRTVAVGSATDEMKNVYDVVLRAQLAGIAAARAGVIGKDVDAAARKVIADAGYGEYFGHGFGHCLGLDIHEPPIAGPTGELPLPEGSVSSAEPGIYLPGKFGVRIEDVMIIRADRAEVITRAPKDELIIL
jgi:Xaa-Pro aminopeptidase